MKVLVVDDEKDIKRLFEQRFRKERRNGEIDLYFAFSAEEALGRIRTDLLNDLKLILSDINMPKMNGFELLKIIRKDKPDLKVFMITAYGDEKNRRMAIENGANDYLIKPLNFRELKDKILGA